MKKKMILIAFMVFLVSIIRAQFVVTDPINMVQGILNTANQIVQTTKTATGVLDNFSETKKIFDQGKQFYDALKSVNNLVKDAKKVQKTVLMVGEISDIYVTNFQRIMTDKNFTEKEIIAIGNGYAILIGESADMLSEVREIVNVSTLSMSDSERMEIIDKVYYRVKKHRDLVSYYTRKNISVSYLRAQKSGDIDRVLSLYGSADERYW